MATRVQAARHITARNTIILWLASVIIIAGIVIIVTYAMLRDQTSKVAGIEAAPLMSTRNATKPVRSVVEIAKAKISDSSKDIRREHDKAIADAALSKASTPTDESP